MIQKGQDRSTTIQDKSGKCLTEEQEILSRWLDYCLELYKYESCGDNAFLQSSQSPENLQPIFNKEVDIAVAALKKGKVCRSGQYTGRTCPCSQGKHDRCFGKSVMKSEKLENGQPHVLHCLKRETYSSARTTEPSVSLVIPVKSW